jgi:hypothetical protein
MNCNIVKGIRWMSPEMGSTLKCIMLEPSLLCVTFYKLVYICVYIYFPLCHKISYQFFPWLEDVNEVFNLIRICG